MHLSYSFINMMQEEFPMSHALINLLRLLQYPTIEFELKICFQR